VFEQKFALLLCVPMIVVLMVFMLPEQQHIPPPQSPPLPSIAATATVSTTCITTITTAAAAAITATTFDADESGQQNSERLANDLSLYVSNLSIYQLDHGDPADLTQKELHAIKREIGIPL